jgi:hypothetical protein
MNPRPLRRTRAHLDSILDGRPTPGDPLADLVAAAQAPAAPGELGGLDAALAVFSSSAGLAATPEEPPVIKSVAGRLLALKVLAITAGMATAGGVAYAAVNGNLDRAPAPSVAAGDSTGAPGSSAAGSSVPGSDGSSAMPGSGSESEPSGNGSSSGSSAESSSTGSSDASSAPGSGTPSPSLKGLCTAWLAHPKNDAKLAGNPAYSVLVSAAGGLDSVNGYCATVLGSASAPSSGQPTHPAHPVHPVHPTQAQNTKVKPTPSTHTKKPHPSQANNTHPQNSKPGNPHKKH